MVLAIGLLLMGLLMMELSRGPNCDFEIYRNSVAGMLHGASVYNPTSPTDTCQVATGFTYPPFSSLVMLPLALLSHTVAKVVLALVTTLLVLSSMFVLIDRIYRKRSDAGAPTIGWVRTPVITTLMALAYPTVNNMGLGQVSFALWLWCFSTPSSFPEDGRARWSDWREPSSSNQ